MDYLPPDKPALIAKADHALLAEYHQHTYKFIDIGKMSQMLDPGDWKSPITLEKWEFLKKHGLKPGQRVIFARPDPTPVPFFYVTEHKPCSAAAYKSFTQFISKDVIELNDKQLQSISEILQEKANSKTYQTQVEIMTVGGRNGINVFFDRSTKNSHYIGRAFFFVANPKKRIIEEFGYEGAPAPNHWRKEADTMFRTVEFYPPGK
jgi:hypothetical protein